MLRVTIDITDIENYREVDRIRVQAQTITVVEDWLYALTCEANLDIEKVTPFSHSRIVGTVQGTFDSLVSPYMYDALDEKVAELKRIWTATFNCVVSEA